MSEMQIHVRLANADDDAFILGLTERFVEFELPVWRKRNETVTGIRRDIARHLSEQPPGTFVFVAEDDAGERLGFLHLHKMVDFFNGHWNCHIADLAVAKGQDGKGIGRKLLEFAEDWAREHDCRLITLGVFPGNVRARELYERNGYGTDMVRMVKAVSTKKRA